VTSCDLLGHYRKFAWNSAAIFVVWRFLRLEYSENRKLVSPIKRYYNRTLNNRSPIFIILLFFIQYFDPEYLLTGVASLKFPFTKTIV